MSNILLVTITANLTAEFVKQVIETGDRKVCSCLVVQVTAHQGNVGRFLLRKGGQSVRLLELKPLTGVNILQREQKTRYLQ